MNVKKGKVFIIFSLFLAIIIAGFCLVSYRAFNSLNNPIMAGVGLAKMKIFNMDYLIIQENPKIILSRPENALNKLEEYMNIQGFILFDRLGSFIVFENDASERQSLTFRVNRYYSI
jgi:hypothetical protein